MKANKEVFSSIGTIEEVEGRKRFVPKSLRFLNHNISKLPVGKVLTCTFFDSVPTRSESQLALYWVIICLISDYTGFSKEETHDFALRAKFGAREVCIGGIVQLVRRSVANVAKMPLSDMVELIDFVKRLAKTLNITIPTAEELGYIPS